MFTISKNSNENYLAKVTTIKNIVKVPKADQLSYTVIGGNCVIVDNSYKI